jgi:hypothetical protein
MSKKKKSRQAAAPEAAATHADNAAVSRGLFVAICAALVVAGAVLRVLAAQGELWLDELWSFRLVHTLTEPTGIFTRLHHDNNHHLNSLYLWFVTESPVWIRYRLHVVAAGIVTLVLAAVLARREGGRAQAFGVTLLLSGSFLMVLYGSEARGYALAVCFAFSAALLAARFLRSGRYLWAASYSIVVVFGILSHLTFLHALLGLMTWTAWRAVRQNGRAGAFRAFAALHVIPLAALVVLYWLDLRHTVAGGGPVHGTLTVIARALSLCVGGPEGGPWLVPAASVAAIAGVLSIALVRRSGSDLWILIAVTAGVAPALTLLTLDTTLLFERYFLVAAAFLTFSFGWLLAAAMQRSHLVALALALAFVLPNAMRIARLIDLGRGAYLPALQHMTARATQHPVTVGSDHDFRNGRLVEFYRQFVPAVDGLEYHTGVEWAAAGPEWMLVHSQDHAFAPKTDLALTGGRRYRLSAFYPTAGVSGWHLAVYHNVLAVPR